MLAAALAATWWLTRPEPPTAPWIGAAQVLAGDGRSGWRDEAADRARFSEPFGVAVRPDGVVVVSDAGTSHRIRVVAADGSVTTLAGGGRGFVDGPGARARFATPSALALAPDGALVVADTGNHAIRRVAPDGTVTTLAGDGVPGFADGPGAQARFNAPVGVAVDAAGRVVVADTYNDSIRVIDMDGTVRTLAGGHDDRIGSSGASVDDAASRPGATGHRDGTGAEARFDTPCGVAVDARGRILVADTGNAAIRAIGTNGVVTTLATPGIALVRPMAVTIDARGDAYVVDEVGHLVVLNADGTARALAGGASGFADGVGGDARFRRPSGIAMVGQALRVAPPRAVREVDRDAPASIVIADAGNALVRLVTPVAAASLGTSGERSTGGATSDATAADTSARHRYKWPWGDVDLASPPAPRIAPAFDADAFARIPLLWPVGTLDGPHEVAGTFGEARGEAGQERFHAGLDIREPRGTTVRAVRDGIVSSPIAAFAFDTLNEGVRIGDIAYIHIRVGRTAAALDISRFAPVYDDSGAMVRIRAKRGALFRTGDVVGSVNRFNHVHMNVGWSGEEHDPLRFRLVQFRDAIPPTIESAGVRLFDEAWTPLNPDRVGAVRGRGRARGRARRPTRLPPLEPVTVRGRVRIVVDAWDRADGNAAHRRLGVRDVGYQVLDRAGRPAPGFEAPRQTIRFDRMRRDADAPRLVYATGSGIPEYGARRTQFLYVATTAYRDGVATPGFWDTVGMPPGEYVLRVFVEDFSGNRTTRDLRVVVAP